MPTLASLTEIPDGREGGIALSSGSVGVLTTGTHTRSFVAEFLQADSPSGDDEAIATPGIPGIGDVYVSASGSYDFSSFCNAVKASQYKAPWVWLLTCSYTSDIDLSNPSGDPLLSPPVFAWGDKTATRPAIVFDAAGNQLAQLNSAGDPIDPPLTDEDTWTTLRLTRNVAAYDPLVNDRFKNAVNDDAWLGFAPGEVLCTGLSAESDYVKGVVVWKLTGTFEIKHDGPDSWAAKILDRGFQSYVTVSGVAYKRSNKDAAGATLASAQLLDGSGVLLPRGGAPVFLTFYTKKRETFAELPLP